MNKFWRWMIEKGYGIINENQDKCLVIYGGSFEVESPQMLVGFFIEYLWAEHGKFYGHPTDSHRKTTILDYYNLLVLKINELEEKT